MARLSTFVLKTGAVVHCKRFMQGPKLSAGYWWRNEYANRWVERVAPHNTDDGKLFGYGEKEFMRKQYKA